VQAATKLPASLRQAVVTAARHEFVNGFAVALMVAGVVVFFASVVVFLFLPARAGDYRAEEESALDGLASLTFAEAEGVLEVDAATS
jgi:hypothetical protein